MKLSLFFSTVMAFAIAGAAVPAHATVDALIDYTVAYQHTQTDDVCLATHRTLASLGVPAAAQAEASLAPALVYRSGDVPAQVNINLLATQPAMVAGYVFDSITDSGVWEYSMTLDVRALAAANGSTVAGRKATVDAAKLLVVVMTENMQLFAPGSWRLSVQILGLPSQSGLSGTYLYPTTRWPYTASSSLVASYRSELINVEGTCPM